MRHILLLALALLALVVVAIAPWSAIQQAFTAFMTPGPRASCLALAPQPNYYVGGGEAAAIEAINHARASEGLSRLALPPNYWQLAQPQQQFTLVNLERASRGLPPLRWDATLAQIATAYSHQMAQLHFFGHTSPLSGDFQDRLNANPQIANHYQAIAENLAGNWAPAAGAIYEYVYNDAAEGCAHRQNILNPQFTFIGIGVAPGGPWQAMSAQELLASNPFNPYISAPPDTTSPSLSLSHTLNASATRLTASAAASDNQRVAHLTWYLDGLGKNHQTGTTWTLDASTLASGRHHLTAYAVDTSQNYTAASLTFTVDAQGIRLNA